MKKRTIISIIVIFVVAAVATVAVFYLRGIDPRRSSTDILLVDRAYVGMSFKEIFKIYPSNRSYDKKEAAWYTRPTTTHYRATKYVGNYNANMTFLFKDYGLFFVEFEFLKSEEQRINLNTFFYYFDILKEKYGDPDEEWITDVEDARNIQNYILSKNKDWDPDSFPEATKLDTPTTFHYKWNGTVEITLGFSVFGVTGCRSLNDCIPLIFNRDGSFIYPAGGIGPKYQDHIFIQYVYNEEFDSL